MEIEEALIYQRSWRFLIRALAVIAVVLGLSILLGGEDRFAGTPTFAYAASFPGGYLTWGVGTMLAGGFTFGASFQWRRRCIITGLFVEMVIFAFFTITIAVSAVEERTTPLTGIAVYGGYTFMCALSYVAGHELRRVRP